MRTISGFTLRRGKKVVGVSVINTRTKDMVLTDQNGRYSIVANKKDKIHFKKEGYKTMVLTLDNRLTENVIMKPE